MTLSELPAADTASLAIEVRQSARDPHEVLVLLRGEIDLSTVSAIRTAMEALDAQQRRVVLDLAGVSFMDSMGVGLLVDLRRRFEPEFHELVLRAPSDQVRQVLKITGLLQVFPILDG